MKKSIGKVYVLLSGNRKVKVGCSSNPDCRKYQIERMSGEQAVKFFTTDICSNPFFVEKTAHKKLRDFNLFGEWFNCDFETAVLEVKDAFDKYAKHDEGELGNEPDGIEDILEALMGYKSVNPEKNVSTEHAIASISEYIGKEIDIGYFREEIDAWIELDENQQVDELKRKYPHLYSGVMNAEEFEAYVLCTYNTLKYSSFTGFKG